MQEDSMKQMMRNPFRITERYGMFPNLFKIIRIIGLNNWFGQKFTINKIESVTENRYN